jgi:hypothetical protein
MTNFEKLMGFLTFLGIVVAALSGVIFWNQMKQMRTDQRAWVVLTSSNFTYPKNDATGEITVVLPMLITNTGKTPARKSVVNIATQIVPNGANVIFDYDRVTVENVVGIIYPNSHLDINAQLLRRNRNAAERSETRYLSSSESKDLTEGRTFLAVYAKGSYTDVFGTAHWYRFCAFGTLSPQPIQVTAESCANYNDSDDD